MPSYLFCHPATHILLEGRQKEREKVVHPLSESSMSSYCYHRAVSTTAILSLSSSVVVIIIIVLLSALPNIIVYLCEFQRSRFFFIAVRFHCRYSVFISIFNISPFFFVLFPLLSRARTLFLRLVSHACVVISRGGRQRLTTIPSVFFFLHPSLSLRFHHLLLLFLGLLLPEICLFVCKIEREREREKAR